MRHLSPLTTGFEPMDFTGPYLFFFFALAAAGYKGPGLRDGRRHRCWSGRHILELKMTRRRKVSLCLAL